MAVGWIQLAETTRVPPAAAVSLHRLENQNAENVLDIGSEPCGTRRQHAEPLGNVRDLQQW